MKKIILLVIVVVYIGCKEDTFSPVGNYEKKAVTYAVLDNRYQNQVIKVQSAYLTKYGDNQSEKEISNLKVSLSDGTNTFYLKDTIITGSENYSYFVSENFNIGRGGIYSLKITGDNIPEAVSQIRVPQKQDLSLFYDSDKIYLSYSKGASVKGFFFHLYVDFYIREGTKILKNYRVEVPSELVYYNEGEDTLFVYPSLTKEIDYEYSYSALLAALSPYKPENNKQKLVVKRSVVTILSLEENLYNYISTVKGFSDPVSVRLDQINYSNIKNGYGVFGAIAIDSTIQKIPAFIVLGFGFESE